MRVHVHRSVLTTSAQGHLPKAIEPLLKRGQQQFEEALQLASQLSAEDAAKLWTSNARNKGVASFEGLITKKDHTEGIAAKPVEVTA